MCGIAGFVSRHDSPDDRDAAVQRMCEAMVHRGPDDRGLTQVGPATLGMRRLAIFDPTHGHQPMATTDGRFTLVFNGAIYNFRALRSELIQLGWSFRTDCDTEVLLAAFATWGEDCLERLRGMFAFAVWDNQDERLFLARDPFGIKPLNYWRDEQGRLLFASELNALLTAHAFRATIDPAGIAEYLAWFAVPAPRTLYREIHSLRPGECAVWEKDQLRVRRYWSFASIPITTNVCGTRAELVSELRRQLEDTLRAHLLADVPVGAFLSGGLDSTIVTGLMSRLGGKQLKTFSIVFPESAYSEAAEAAETARFLGTDHTAFELTGERVARDIEGIIEHLDQPTGDGINTYYASLAARSGGVTAALSGLGGDELFGGYPSFKTAPKLARWLPRWQMLPDGVKHTIIGRLRNSDTRKRKLADYLQHARSLPEVTAMQRRVFDESTRHSLLAPDLRRELPNSAPFHPEFADLAHELMGMGEFEKISAWELRTYMADVLLRDSDVMSMRHSLELRVPFVDRPLIEWLWRQKAEFKYDPRQPKSVLADAASDVLPPGLAKRRKRGFTLPFPLWMRNELKPFLEETFSHVNVNRSGLFAREPVQALWQRFLHSRDDRAWSRVWSLAMLIAFVNRSPSR